MEQFQRPKNNLSGQTYLCPILYHKNSELWLCLRQSLQEYAVFQKYFFESRPIVGIPSLARLSAIDCSNPYHPPSPEINKAIGACLSWILEFVIINREIFNLTNI